MHDEHEGLTPELLRRQLKAMADITLSEQTEAKFNLFAGMLMTMKMLQPQGYQQSVPAFIFQTEKE